MLKDWMDECTHKCMRGSFVQIPDRVLLSSVIRLCCLMWKAQQGLLIKYLKGYKISMENYINKPIEYNWIEKDVISEYEKIKDKRKVAKIFCIKLKQVSDILKGRGM